MALTYPLSFDNFIDEMNATEAEFYLPNGLNWSGQTGRGEIVTAEVGARLWYGVVKVDTLDTADAEEVKARIANMLNSGNSFFLYPLQRPAPRKDPSGSGLAGHTPLIGAVSDNLVLPIKALPAYYPLSIGDYVSYEYGSSPTRYGFHQFAESANADSSGNVNISLTAPLRDGAVEDIELTLVKPKLKALIDPDTVKNGSFKQMTTTGITFSWQQTLR